MDKDHITGELKEAEGKLTGDDARELQGKAESAFGELKDKARDAAEDLEDIVDGDGRDRT